MVDHEKAELANRRLVSVPISFDLLVDLMIKGRTVKSVEIVDGLPENAEFVGSTFSESEMIAYLFFAHPSFDSIPAGGLVPRMLITHKRLDLT